MEDNIGLEFIVCVSYLVILPSSLYNPLVLEFEKVPAWSITTLM